MQHGLQGKMGTVHATGKDALQAGRATSSETLLHDFQSNILEEAIELR